MLVIGETAGREEVHGYCLYIKVLKLEKRDCREKYQVFIIVRYK